ncbi:hypothetical protein D6829_02815 [Candidatus Pacearchaeota archaeon]|nr:MAG: hypothetical protein D6829_02815 [Candidatus Pacearchaeota archaeon]
MDSADFSSGVIVSGIARNPFEDKWYFSTASSKNTSEFRFTTTSYSFNYQLKDQGIGYPIYENFDPNSSVDFVTLSLPADRNYSFMVYPQGGPSFPVKIDIANIANGTNVSGCGLIDENLTIDCTGLNLSTNLRRLSGYAIYNSSLSEQNYTNFTIIGYLLESGDMVFSGATLPPNMSQFSPEGGSDIFNTTSGFYNMTVPGAALGANLILFATAAVNLSGTIKYYGGFRNITVGYSGTIPQLNFTLYPLMGSPSNLSTGLGGSGGSGGSSTVYTALKRINFVNETNDTVTGVFTEIMVDYSSVSGSGVSFSWMADAQNGYVELPLINQAGVARIEAFNMNYAPRKGKISKIDLDSSQAYNFTLKKFKPFNPENSSYNTNSINLSFFRSNSECSVPKPGSSCSAMSNTNVSNFNPLTVMMSGAKIDFEMKDPNSGIVVRYIDVDMLASGPPDAIFDPTANSSSSGSSLEEAWRFGSSGPEIYKKVLIGVPYNTTQINSSYTVRINITRFYDDENLNNSFWKQGVNSTSQLSGTDYEEYASDDYKEFINGTGVLCSTSDENLTSSLCYRDSSNGMLWFEIPHFSGIAPTVSASSSTTGPSSPDNDDNDNGGGGNGRGNNDNYFYIFNFLATNKQIEEGYTKSLAKKSMVRFKIGNETHSVGVIEVLTKSVKINVSSKPQQAVLTVGESKKFEVTGDKFYDVLVKLNGIANNRANLTIKKIHEEIKNETNQKKVEDRGEPSNNKSPEEKKEKTKTSLTGIWISLVVIVLIALGWYFSKRYRSSSESETGPLKEKTSGQKRNKKKN